MAKDRANKKGDTADQYVPSENVRVNGGDIVSAVQGFDGNSYEKGYPSIANPDMHNNQGRGGERIRGSHGR